MTVVDMGKRAIVSAACRTPPHVTRALPAALARRRLLTFQSEALRVNPVRFSAAPTRFGFSMSGDTADLLQRCVYLFGVWEPNISRWTTGFLRPGDVVVDVGANVGYFSLLCASAVGPEGRVIAFEPVPSIVEALRANLAENGSPPVVVEPVVASDEPGEVEIFRGAPDNLGESATTAGAGRVSEGAVPRVRAADRIDPALWPSVRLVKVDTEGDDLRALMGLEPVLRAMRPGSAALVEVSPDELAERGQTPEALGDYMSSVGFGRILEIDNSYERAAYVDDSDRPPSPVAAVPSRKADVVFLK